jgi:EmrB/QacA subfamily drug resistance transporter
MTNENSSQRVVVAVVYVAAMFMSVLDTTIVSVALPAIARDLGTTPAAVGVVQVAYLVALTVAIPFSGWLGDRIGGKRALLGAIGLFTLGSALCACAISLPMLVGFSILQGVGGAVMLPVGLATLFRVYPPHERVHLSSVLALVTAIGPALGPVLGGVLTTYASWRWVFLVNVPVGLAVIGWGLARMHPHAQPHPGRLDVLGGVLAAVGLGALMAGVSEGASLGWTDVRVLVPAVVGVALLVLLVVVELRVERPLIDVRLFRQHRLFAAATALYGLGSVAYIGALYVIAQFLQAGLGFTALVSGLTSVGSAVGVMAGGQIVSRVLYPRLGPRRILAGGLVLIAAGLVPLAFVDAGTNLWWVRVALFVLGLGVSGVFIPSQAISMATISKADTGRASPLFNAGKQLGSAVGVALLATVIGLTSTGHGAGTGTGTAPYHAAFLVAAGVALAAVAVALTVRDRDAAGTMRR